MAASGVVELRVPRVWLRWWAAALFVTFLLIVAVFGATPLKAFWHLRSDPEDIHAQSILWVYGIKFVIFAVGAAIGFPLVWWWWVRMMGRVYVRIESGRISGNLLVPGSKEFDFDIGDLFSIIVRRRSDRHVLALTLNYNDGSVTFARLPGMDAALDAILSQRTKGIDVVEVKPRIAMSVVWKLLGVIALFAALIVWIEFLKRHAAVVLPASTIAGGLAIVGVLTLGLVVWMIRRKEYKVLGSVLHLIISLSIFTMIVLFTLYAMEKLSRHNENIEIPDQTSHVQVPESKN